MVVDEYIYCSSGKLATSGDHEYKPPGAACAGIVSRSSLTDGSPRCQYSEPGNRFILHCE